MTNLQAVTIIRAPIQQCFELSLNIDLEQGAATEYGLQAVSGVTSGMIKLGERVTWRAKQFGIWVRHTTEITAYDSPNYFQDSMIAGVFRFFAHDHYFSSSDATHTEMRDEMHFAMPFWLTGAVAERLFVGRRMQALLLKRNAAIKQRAEDGY